MLGGWRHRPGVVRAVPARVPGLQQPDPGGELGLNVQHPLPARDQRLGREVAQAGGARDRPRPLWPARESIPTTAVISTLHNAVAEG